MKKVKTIKERMYRLFIKDFDAKLKSAKQTHKMILSSTKGSIGHFYNNDGEEIRGYYKRPARFNNILPTHPLILKYK
jgi:hypothetical protein